MNAGCKCPGLIDIRALWVKLQDADSRIGLAFVTELDGRAMSHSSGSSSAVVVHRHHPGPGSRAMAWMMRLGIRKILKSLERRGRAGAVHLCGRDPGDQLVSLWAVGWHGAHGDSWWQSAADLSYLVHRKPPGCALVVCGDWNVDFLSTLEPDPFAEERRDRGTDDFELRHAVLAQADDWGCELQLPESVVGSPGGSFAMHALSSPITRVPLGANVDREVPSLLDFVVASYPAKPVVDWTPCLADHAVIILDAPLLAPRKPRRARTWHCSDDLAMDKFMESDLRRAPDADVAAVIQEAAFPFQEVGTCRERREA